MPIVLPKRPRTLEFDSVELTIEDMELIGQQTNLVGLVIHNCPLTDEHIKPLQHLSKMKNLTITSTNISDAALEYLAPMTKLEYLFVDDNKHIDGSGLAWLHDLPIHCIWACRTSMNDDGLALAAQLPKLAVLRADGTQLTAEGLMSVATNPNLEVIAEDLFTPEQQATFQAEQRNLKKSKKEVNPEAKASAELVLTSFFKAMTNWELRAYQVGINDPTMMEQCQSIFDTYVVHKPRKGFRPNSLSISSPPKYENHNIVDIEQVTRNKLYFYTVDRLDFKHRFLVVHQAGIWKIDEVKRMSGGWKLEGL